MGCDYIANPCGPILVWSQQHYQRLVKTVGCLGVLSQVPSREEKVSAKMNDYILISFIFKSWNKWKHIFNQPWRCMSFIKALYLLKCLNQLLHCYKF